MVRRFYSDRIEGVGKSAQKQKIEVARREKEKKGFSFLASGGVAADEDTMKNENTNLPAVVGTTFNLVSTSNVPALSPELAAVLEPADFDGFDTPDGIMPIASIRQKPDIDPDTGKVVVNPGGWKLYDAISKAANRTVIDVGGDAGLIVTVLGDQISRVYFPALESTEPACRSIDGVTGVGDPGGQCGVCRLSQFLQGERPKCQQQDNLLVFDHTLQGCYIVRLGPSGLKPYSLYKAFIARGGNKRIPLSILVTRIATRYEAKPAPHFVPVFEICQTEQFPNGQIPVELFMQFKEIRQTMVERIKRSVEATTTNEEQPNGTTFRTADAGAELPDGVVPVGDALNEDEDDSSQLPF